MKTLLDPNNRDLIDAQLAVLHGTDLGDPTVALVYGNGVSEEDRLYRSQSPVEQLSVTALGDSLTEIGLKWAELDPCSPAFVQDVTTNYDLVLSNLHGPYGEDGCLQGLLDWVRVPYCGNGVAACAVGADKIHSKAFMTALGIPTPPWQVWNGSAISVRWSGLPLMIKPSLGGSSVGMQLVRHGDELRTALRRARDVDQAPVLVEEFISGTPVTVGLLELPGGIVAFPPLTTDVHGADYYDAATKLDADRRGPVTVELAEFPPHILELLTRHAYTLWDVMGCRGALRVDFIVTGQGVPYALEVNPTPGMSRDGNFAIGACTVGMSHADMVRAYVHEALSRPAYDVPLPAPQFTGPSRAGNAA
ncbi:ATP-grasp domain-containing protein (plasmid) [Streptomyces sp. NBC_00015]|uniref:D-alanine--D-alanine ligase family protein n=1 Tax=Streptomyces sp. NBC_00015 TaxID=2903611 RepID=UPI002F91A81B